MSHDSPLEKEVALPNPPLEKGGWGDFFENATQKIPLVSL